jgi:hypothetical protein
MPAARLILPAQTLLVPVAGMAKNSHLHSRQSLRNVPIFWRLQ